MYIKMYEPGDFPLETYPGDFILTRRDGAFMGKCITFFQNLTGQPKEATFWSHAAMVIGRNGEIQEALEWGVERNNLQEQYVDSWVLYVHTEVSQEDLRQMEVFWNSVWEHKQNYGYIHIASLALALLTKTRFMFGVSGTSICSGQVAGTLVRSGWIFDSEPSHVMPSDLYIKAHYYLGRLAQRQRQRT